MTCGKLGGTAKNPAVYLVEVQEMDRKDYALLALLFADKPLNPVHVQKVLFVFGRETAQPGFYEFEPWDFGPYAPEIYRDLEAAQSNGLIEILPGQPRRYALTKEGESAAEALRAKVAPKDGEFLESLSVWARDLSFSAIVQAIYRRYPEYRERSIFQG